MMAKRPDVPICGNSAPYRSVVSAANDADFTLVNKTGYTIREIYTVNKVSIKYDRNTKTVSADSE